MVYKLQITTLLFFITVAISSGKQSEERHSRLILEYDWLEPKKNLQRFPHATSCSHFYVIRTDGSQTIKKCPANELFDSRTLRCREKTSATCWNDLLKKGPTKIAKKNAFKCPFPWGLYPDIEDCTMFYDCLSGRPYPRKCPISTLFDKVERTCVDENEAMCADHLDVVEDDYKCPFKWGYFTYSKDCSKYYECLRKIPSLRTCKKNMLFDNFKRKCMPMSSVECGERFNPYGNGRRTTEVPTRNERMTTERIQTGREQVRKVSNFSPNWEEKVTKKRELTDSEGMTTDYTVSVQKRVTTESIPTEHDEVTTDRFSTGRPRDKTESILTGIERFTTDGILTRRERMTTDRMTTGREQMTTDRPTTGRERMTTDRLTTGLERMATDRISTGRERMTTDRITTGFRRRTTDPTTIGRERKTTDRIATGRLTTASVRIETEGKRNTPKLVLTEGGRTTTNHLSTLYERMATESPLIVQERVTTDRDVGTTRRMSSGRERWTSERNPTGNELGTTAHSSAESGRVTSGHIHTGSDQVTALYITSDE